MRLHTALVAALLVAASVFVPVSTTSALAADSAPLIVLPSSGDVTVNVVSKDALDQQSLSTTAPVARPICDDCQGGESVDIGQQTKGAEVAFLEDGVPSSDRARASLLLQTTSGLNTIWRVGFEDGADADYNDLVVQVVLIPNTGAATAPVVSVTPRTGTVTTPFTVTTTCPAGREPLTPTVSAKNPNGTLQRIKKGPSLAIQSNSILPGGLTRVSVLKIGPDLADAQAQGNVVIVGSCSGAGIAPSPQYPIRIVGNSFVVLGDSFSAGEGNPPFTTGTDLGSVGRTSTGCHRSSAGWAHLLAGAAGRTNPSDALAEPSAWTFAACSGAVIRDLTNPNTIYASAGESEVAQDNALTSSAATAAMTVGGNDVGFTDILKACIVTPAKTGSSISGTDKTCRDPSTKISKATAKKLAALGPQLIAAYTKAAGRMAPNGTLYVAGYPHLFGSDKKSFDGGRCYVLGAHQVDVGFSFGYDDAQWINTLVDQGDRTIAASARAAQQALTAAGSARHIVFAGNSADGSGGVRTQFAGHGLCDTGTAFLNRLNLDSTHLKPFQTSFHPNRQGQIAYARAFETQMRLKLSSF